MWPFVWLMYICLPGISSEEQCGTPAKPAHGRLSSIRPFYDNGEVVKVTCEPSHLLFGKSLFECIHGAWTDRPPVCLRNIAYGHELWFGSNCIGRPIPQGGKFLHIMCDKDEKVFFHVFLNESAYQAIVFFRGSIRAKDVYGNEVPLIPVMLTLTRDPEPSLFFPCPKSLSGEYFDCKSTTPINGAKIEVTVRNQDDYDRIKPVTVELQMEDNGFVVATYSEVNCGTPPAPLHGLVSATSPTEAKYECQPSYALIGKVVQKCDTSRYPEIVWRSDVPTCLAKPQNATARTEENTQDTNLVLVAVFISVGCFLLILTVMGVVWCCTKQWGKKQVMPSTVPLANLLSNTENSGCDAGYLNTSYFTMQPMLPTVQYPLVVSQNYSPSEYSSRTSYQNTQPSYENVLSEPLYATIGDSD